jgi:hypothetical protein
MVSFTSRAADGDAVRLRFGDGGVDVRISVSPAARGVGWSAVFIVMASIGITSLMSGTAATDFGGRKATATSMGIVNGFAYIGSGIQSLGLGFLLAAKDANWQWLPIFVMPFAVIGTLISIKSGMTFLRPRVNTSPRLSKKRCKFGQIRGLTGPGIAFRLNPQC